MLKRILLTFFIFFTFTFGASGQETPTDMMQQDLSQQNISQQNISQQDISQQDISQQDIIQQEQELEAHALEQEKADPRKIGNLSQSSLIENFKKGGIIMYFILACSVIGVYVTIERTFSLQRSRVIPRKFINNILNIITNAPPRIQGPGQQYPPPPAYRPGPAGGYQSFSPPLPPSPGVGSPPPAQPQQQPQSPLPPRQDQGARSMGNNAIHQPPPAPKPVPKQEPPEASFLPGGGEELKKDMDSLLDILNKGLDEIPSDTNNEAHPQRSFQTNSFAPSEEDSGEPDKGGSGTGGSQSPPMNMSYPVGASYGGGANPPGQGGYGYGSQEQDVVDQMLDYCEGKDIPLARVLKAGLLVYNEGILSVKSAITNANLHEGAVMEKGVGALGVLANVAPLLGLLGTVTGMIKAFEMISIGGTGRPEIVANGIAEALTTTAGGLFVGIPLLLLFHWLQGKIETMLIDLQEFSVDVVEKIIRGGK
jgi:biopolymer transport protein ExbB